MSDVDVCKCGHLAKAHDYKGCERRWICPCTKFESACCKTYAYPPPDGVAR